ncbi:SURF1 family protein [Myxococcota bacterium]|nr:SURF1 family protein [Myxococcota bacterium]
MRLKILLTGLLIVFGVVNLARLGLWQLRRNDETAAVVAELKERQALPPGGAELLGLTGDEANFRRLRLDVVAQAEPYALLAGRYVGGEPGYHLIQRVTVPAAPPGAPNELLVDRGWIPLDGAEERARSLGGPMTLSGVARASAEFDAEAPPSPDGRRWRVMAPTTIREALGAKTPDWFMIAGEPLAEGEQPKPDVLPASGYHNTIRTRPHLEYAWTWFGLSATLGIAGVVALWVSQRARAESAETGSN